MDVNFHVYVTQYNFLIADATAFFYNNIIDKDLHRYFYTFVNLLYTVSLQNVYWFNKYGI